MVGAQRDPRPRARGCRQHRRRRDRRATPGRRSARDLGRQSYRTIRPCSPRPTGRPTDPFSATNWLRSRRSSVVAVAAKRTPQPRGLKLVRDAHRGRPRPPPPTVLRTTRSPCRARIGSGAPARARVQGPARGGLPARLDSFNGGDLGALGTGVGFGCWHNRPRRVAWCGWEST